MVYSKKEWATTILDVALREIEELPDEAVTTYSSEYLSHKLDTNGVTVRRVFVEYEVPSPRGNTDVTD